MSSDGRSSGVSILGSHQMTLEVLGKFDHLNLVIVLESKTMCAKENLVKEDDTTNLFNFYLIEKKISLKQISNVPMSPLLLMQNKY